MTVTLIILVLTALAAFGFGRTASRTDARIRAMPATTPPCDRCDAFVWDGSCRRRRSDALAA